MTNHLGIQYLYADTNNQEWINDAPPLRPPLTAQELAVMPQDRVIALYNASLSCEQKAVKHLLQQIPTEYTFLKRSLEEATQNFNFQLIMHLTKSYLDSRE